MSQDAARIARQMVGSHKHRTKQGTMGIDTDITIRSCVRFPFPAIKVQSPQKVLRLNADLLDGYHLSEIIALLTPAPIITSFDYIDFDPLDFS